MRMRTCTTIIVEMYAIWEFIIVRANLSNQPSELLAQFKGSVRNSE